MSIEARMSIAEGLAVILRSNRKLDWRIVIGEEAASDPVQIEYVFNERMSGLQYIRYMKYYFHLQPSQAVNNMSSIGKTDYPVLSQLSPRLKIPQLKSAAAANPIGTARVPFFMRMIWRAARTYRQISSFGR